MSAVIQPGRFGGVAPCTSSIVGKWSVVTCTGTTATITTNSETITVPTGNLGSINLHCDNNSATVQYEKNAGTWINLVNNADNIVSFANNDTLKFRTVAASGNCLANSGNIGPFTGTVKDNTTGTTLDTFNISW